MEKEALNNLSRKEVVTAGSVHWGDVLNVKKIWQCQELHMQLIRGDLIIFYFFISGIFEQQQQKKGKKRGIKK